MPIVSCFCLKICFRLVASVLFFFISRSPFLCALSASIIGSVSHPAGDRPSHPICETTYQDLAAEWMEDCPGQRNHRFYFVTFIFGNFRLTAATTEACSGFPELLAKASRA